jgi:hypothetical protein
MVLILPLNASQHSSCYTFSRNRARTWLLSTSLHLNCSRYGLWRAEILAQNIEAPHGDRSPAEPAARQVETFSVTVSFTRLEDRTVTGKARRVACEKATGWEQNSR